MVEEKLDMELSETETDQITDNANCLSHEISWFARQVNMRLTAHFSGSPESRNEIFNGKLIHENGADQKSPPDFTSSTSVYADFVNYYQLTSDERMLLMLALIPHIQPHLLDVFLQQINPVEGVTQNLEE